MKPALLGENKPTFIVIFFFNIFYDLFLEFSNY